MTNSSRTSGAELPSSNELMEILEHESQRKALKYDFLQTNSTVFGSFREFAESEGIEVDWIETYNNLSLDELLKRIGASLEKIKNSIVLNPACIEVFEEIYKSLIPPEDESKSDLIYVFGAASNARIERAAELFKQGVAPKIMVSGNRPIYSSSEESEAERMADVARSLGVPDNVLLLETESITVPDNVKRSLDLLEPSWQPRSISIVATNFVLRRAYMEWYKFTPWDIQIKPVAARPQSETFTPHGWHKDEKTISLVLNEYAKLVIESKMDFILSAE